MSVTRNERKKLRIHIDPAVGWLRSRIRRVPVITRIILEGPSKLRYKVKKMGDHVDAYSYKDVIYIKSSQIFFTIPFSTRKN